MNNDITAIITDLKKINLESLDVYFWVVQRKLHIRKGSYKVLSVNIGNINKDFISLLKQFIEDIEPISYYKPITENLDEEGSLYARSEETDFNDIIGELDKGSDNDPVLDIEELNKAWAYIVEFKNDKHRIISFSKIHEGWNILKQKKLLNIIFKEGKFDEIIDGNIFPLNRSFDFIAFNNNVFIKNKNNYEMALNIREGLLLERDIIVKELFKLGIIENIKTFNTAINNNKKYLRKLAMAKDNGYYTDPEFLKAMEHFIKQNKWNLIRINGKFIITEDNIELFLTIINNGRLKSPINNEIFDADIKRKVLV
jgi:hypothetical protein